MAEVWKIGDRVMARTSGAGHKVWVITEHRDTLVMVEAEEQTARRKRPTRSFRVGDIKRAPERPGARMEG